MVEMNIIHFLIFHFKSRGDFRTISFVELRCWSYETKNTKDRKDMMKGSNMSVFDKAREI